MGVFPRGTAFTNAVHQSMLCQSTLSQARLNATKLCLRQF
jgi:hypothetical protein